MLLINLRMLAMQDFETFGKDGRRNSRDQLTNLEDLGDAINIEQYLPENRKNNFDNMGSLKL